MTYKEILVQLRKKEYRPVYVLHGEEPFFIDLISDFIEDKVLSAADKSFNQSVLYGKEVDAMAVADVARRYPMMSERQVVIVKEAQDMKTLADLLAYVEKPMPTTVLVLCHKYKKLDMRTKFAKALGQHALVFESAKLYENQIADWVATYAKDINLQLKPDICDLIAEYLGNDLSKISNELDKLLLNVPTGTAVTTEQVQKNIGISKDYNVFELQKALGAHDVTKANRIVQYFAVNQKKNPLVVVIATLYGYFSKVYMLFFLKNMSDREQASKLQLRSEYVLKDYKLALKNYPLGKVEHIISHLMRYDLRSKGVDDTGTDDGELLKELVFKILH